MLQLQLTLNLTLNLILMLILMFSVSGISMLIDPPSLLGRVRCKLFVVEVAVEVAIDVAVDFAVDFAVAVDVEVDLDVDLDRDESTRVKTWSGSMQVAVAVEVEASSGPHGRGGVVGAERFGLK
jgi:hypothetical protein